MLRIEFNQDLFETHIDKIYKSIKNLITDDLKNTSNPLDKECLEFIDNNLKKLLKANPKQLKEYIFYFSIKYPNSIGIQNQKEENWNPLYKILRKEVFGKEYKNWGTRKNYGSYTFVDTLGLKTCPYCNRNYTFIVDEETGKLRPELDHFYPKSIYPFLAMSFYNLIPSCPTCNHTKKDKVNLDLINPYEIKENDFKLTYLPNDIDFFKIEKEKYDYENFEIKFISNNPNIEIFKLDELYKQHKDIVLDLLIKKVHYPKSYIKELSSFGFNKEEIYRYLVNNYLKDDDLHKRPLSKLIKDISKELGLE